jgi:phage terminase large subunit-like protein
LRAFGFNCDDVFQGENLTPIIDETEGIIKDGLFDFGNNDLMKMHLLDAGVKMNNNNGRRRLIKTFTTGRIDGTAALLDAMCVRQKWSGEIGEQLKNRR